MKNIHIIPTDKSSRLIHNVLGYAVIVTDDFTKSDLALIQAKFQNIYITSNEEIKANVYALINGVLCKTEIREGKIVSRQLIGGGTMDICKSEYFEIILTTDQDLIKDGVQAIDDEFLEWFVKNPSCEFLEVVNKYYYNGSNNEIPPHISLDNLGSWGYGKYKIIIPKEEPKQNLEKEMFELEQEIDIPSHLRWYNSKPKQETIEKAAKIHLNSGKIPNDYQSFIQGAKWQSKRMYSDEEVEVIAKDAYSMGRNNILIGVFNKWFKQFKKK